MYSALQSIHSFLPYLLIAALVSGILINIAKRFGGRSFKKGDKILAVVGLALTHLQLLVGLALYAVSPRINAAFNSGELMSNANHRLYAIEHPLAMIVAVVLVTIGYSKAKRKENDAAKFQTLAIFYGIALVVLLSRIPWSEWLA